MITRSQIKRVLLRFSTPIAAKAVNELNRQFKQQKETNRAFLFSDRVAEIWGENAGRAVDIVDDVLTKYDGRRAEA